MLRAIVLFHLIESLFIGPLDNHNSSACSQTGKDTETSQNPISDSESPEQDSKPFLQEAPQPIAEQLPSKVPLYPNPASCETTETAESASTDLKCMGSFETCVKMIGEGACERKCIFCAEMFPDTIALYQHKRYHCCKNPEVLIHQASAAALASHNPIQTTLQTFSNGATSYDLYNVANSNSVLDSKTGSALAGVNQANAQLERKKRTVYTDKQLETLRDCYLKQPNPTSDDIEKIASNIGLTKRNVQVWFQNKRARDKKNPGIYDFLDSTLDRISMGGSSPTPSTGQDLTIKIPTSPASTQDTTSSNPLTSSFSKVAAGLHSCAGAKESPSPLKPDPELLGAGGAENMLPSAFYSYQWLSLLSFYQAIATSNLLSAGGVTNPSLLQSQLANLAMLAGNTGKLEGNLTCLIFTSYTESMVN